MKHFLFHLHTLRGRGDTDVGFVMLFTVLIVSLILTLALGISDITLKQSILSGLAKDSGIAFYQADTAVECGMYEDTTLGAFPYNATVNTGSSTDVPQTFYCGDTLMQLGQSAPNYFEYDPQGVEPNVPCFSIVFDKSNPDTLFRVDGLGLSRCGANPKQVERTLEVKY